MFLDAFLGAGVPLGGDPVTSFQNVSLLGLRTGTVLNNSKPRVGDVVKVRLIATNCGERGLEIIPLVQAGRERDWDPSQDNVLTLPPGQSVESSVFRSWEAAGEHQLALTFTARRPGKPFTRLVYPLVTIHVGHPEGNRLNHWIACLRAVHPQAESSESRAAHW
jgi:hypothetical protein